MGTQQIQQSHPAPLFFFVVVFLDPLLFPSPSLLSTQLRAPGLFFRDSI
jgi:hypothetical protein